MVKGEIGGRIEGWREKGKVLGEKGEVNRQRLWERLRGWERNQETDRERERQRKTETDREMCTHMTIYWQYEIDMVRFLSILPTRRGLGMWIWHTLPSMKENILLTCPPYYTLLLLCDCSCAHAISFSSISYDIVWLIYDINIVIGIKFLRSYSSFKRRHIFHGMVTNITIVWTKNSTWLCESWLMAILRRAWRCRVLIETWWRW